MNAACTFLSALFLAALISGCGGCQPGSVPENGEGGGGGARKAAPAGAAAGTPATTAAKAAQMPTARELPTMKGGEKPPAAGAQAPQGGAPAEEPAEEDDAEEADCSVIADAEPDYGPPPLTVNFSVDYECTEGSARVSWDFGDHSAGGSDDNPIHTYREGGEFTAVVTITTPDGAKATDEIDITVEAEDESPPDVEPENP